MIKIKQANRLTLGNRDTGTVFVQDPQALVTNYDLGSKELQNKTTTKKNRPFRFLH